MCNAKPGYSCVTPRRSLSTGSSTSWILQVRLIRSVTDDRGRHGAAGRVPQKVPGECLLESGFGHLWRTASRPRLGSARLGAVTVSIVCCSARVTCVLILSRIRALSLSQSVRTMTTGVPWTLFFSTRTNTTSRVRLCGPLKLFPCEF